MVCCEHFSRNKLLLLGYSRLLQGGVAQPIIAHNLMRDWRRVLQNHHERSAKMLQACRVLRPALRVGALPAICFLMAVAGPEWLHLLDLP